MNDWFTIENIDDTTFAISEYGHWEQMHSYLLLGAGQALLIDTGLGIGNIREVVDGITDLPVKVVTTHVHWDHIGGHRFFNDIAVHGGDLEWLRSGLPLSMESIKAGLMKEPFAIEPPADFDLKTYRVYTGEPARILTEGDFMDIGNRKINAIHTPGHSPGHICLYESDRGYIYTGDLIYRGTLYAFYPSTDPVDFKMSVARIDALKNITMVLPAHNELNVPVDIIRQVKDAFDMIARDGLLKHGSGIFEFADFRIHI